MHLKEVDANLLVTLDALLVDASVTRAAERLGRSASAISHALAKLREIFDDELFVRAGQKLVPTAKALELAPTVHVILAGMESLLRPNKPFDPSLSVRDFAIAASEAGELILVQPLRQRLQPLAPNVRLGWMKSNGDESTDALRYGRCHFVIDIEGAPLQAPDIRALKLFDDKLATLVRPGHAFAERKPRAATFAGADHIAVNSLSGHRANRPRACRTQTLLQHLRASPLGAGRPAARVEQRCAAHPPGFARADAGKAIRRGAHRPAT